MSPDGASPRASEESPPELAPGYYVENFLQILRTVGSRYDDLLSEREKRFAATFEEISEDARRLFVRLISRKGPFFRLDLLRYDEIADLPAAAAELEDAGLLRRARAQTNLAETNLAETDPAELLPTLRKPELVEAARALGAPAGIGRQRRPEIVARLHEGASEELRRWLLDRYVFLRPDADDEVRIHRLLFFGDLRKDLSRFVVRDLGIVRYVDYPLHRELRLFRSRREIDHHLHLRLLRREVRSLLARRSGEALEASRLDAAVELAEDVLRGEWHPSARRQADRVLVKVGRALERAGRDDESLRFYRAAETPPARERRCRVLERRGETARALELCREMAAAPRDEREAETAPVIERRLARRLGLEVPPRRRRPTVEIELPAPTEDDALMESKGVESRVVEHLERRGRTAIHSENWLWKSLFGLAFWDVIFAPVPGVFEHPFQLGPLDLHTADFRKARAAEVEERLRSLAEESDLASRLRAVYEEKKGLANAFVPWHPGLEAPLFRSLEILRGRELAVICDRLSRDPGRYRRGLPDLLVAEREAPGGFELWEVKAPGDQLRPEQKSWIDHLRRKGILTRIARVLWE